ncbi:hypothetical protein [Arthrobacter ginkgonis]|uniref:hypothetical protein n=1 Tax=Arthrobacter ginkgonis TaxID=1630594 RepID=UPI0031ECE426
MIENKNINWFNLITVFRVGERCHSVDGEAMTRTLPTPSTPSAGQRARINPTLELGPFPHGHMGGTK